MLSPPAPLTPPSITSRCQQCAQGCIFCLPPSLGGPGKGQPQAREARGDPRHRGLTCALTGRAGGRGRAGLWAVGLEANAEDVVSRLRRSDAEDAAGCRGMEAGRDAAGRCRGLRAEDTAVAATGTRWGVPRAATHCPNQNQSPFRADLPSTANLHHGWIFTHGTVGSTGRDCGGASSCTPSGKAEKLPATELSPLGRLLAKFSQLITSSEQSSGCLALGQSHRGPVPRGSCPNLCIYL